MTTPPYVIDATVSGLSVGEIVTAVSHLIPQVSRSRTAVTPEQIKRVLRASDSYRLLLLMSDGLVAGMLTLAYDIIAEKAYVNDVVVDKPHRGKGFGTKLLKRGVSFVVATWPSVSRIDLSNRPDHEAEVFYRSLGFVPRTEEEHDPTTVYRLEL